MFRDCEDWKPKPLMRLDGKFEIIVACFLNPEEVKSVVSLRIFLGWWWWLLKQHNIPLHMIVWWMHQNKDPNGDSSGFFFFSTWSSYFSSACKFEWPSHFKFGKVRCSFVSIFVGYYGYVWGWIQSTKNNTLIRSCIKVFLISFVGLCRKRNLVLLASFSIFVCKCFKKYLQEEDKDFIMHKRWDC